MSTKKSLQSAPVGLRTIPTMLMKINSRCFLGCAVQIFQVQFWNPGIFFFNHIPGAFFQNEIPVVFQVVGNPAFKNAYQICKNVTCYFDRTIFLFMKDVSFFFFSLQVNYLICNFIVKEMLPIYTVSKINHWFDWWKYYQSKQEDIDYSNQWKEKPLPQFPQNNIKSCWLCLHDRRYLECDI